MRRALRWFVMAALLAVAVSCAPQLRAQEPRDAAVPTRTAGGAEATPHSDPWLWWKAANFAILVGLLVYLAKKHGAGLFERRSEQIRLAIVESARAKQEADERLAETERRLARLPADIEQLRAEALAEMGAEGERIRQETARHVERLRRQTEQEIEHMTKTARRELRTYSAEAALAMAERQIGARITPEVENRLVEQFIAGLHDGAARRNTSN